MSGDNISLKFGRRGTPLTRGLVRWPNQSV